MKKLLIALLTLSVLSLVGCKKMSVDEINEKLSDDTGVTTTETQKQDDPFTVEVSKHEYTSNNGYSVEGKLTSNTKNTGFTSIEIELLNDKDEVVDIARINLGAIKVGETLDFSGSAIGEGITKLGNIKVSGY